jgi:hypothetical protein
MEDYELFNSYIEENNNMQVFSRPQQITELKNKKD